ncbi:MAG: hypothetical protein HC938_04265 [Nitrospira sp.]|nr:hypothetical protein [Nitrospira sp.]
MSRLSPLAIQPYTPSKEPVLAWTAVTVIALSFLALVIFLQQKLDLRIDAHAAKIEELAQLPRGEYLKPALLGYHHVGAGWLMATTPPSPREKEQYGRRV